MILALSILTLCLGARRLRAQEFVIIAHPSIAMSSLTTDQASGLFLKRITRWEDNSPVVPVDLDESSKTRQAFTRVIHRKTVYLIKTYWQQQIFSGREVPPAEKPNEAEVIAFVRSTPGAVAYVSANAPVQGLKVLSLR
jgi:ABC-type phosphate transport system substrate-binding protein